MTQTGTSQELEAQIAAARAGSSEAIGELLTLYRESLRVLAQQRLAPYQRKQSIASDIVQNTLLSAHASFASFRGSSERELFAWLRRILVNNIIDYARRHERESSVFESPADGSSWNAIEAVPGSEASPSQEVLKKEQTELVQAAIERLPVEFQEVLHFRNRERLCFREIGLRMERTEDSARALWYRALKALQTELGIPG